MLGALFGSTEEEAFFITCDRTTMSQDDILNGRLICEIGIAPVRPAEYIIVRIHQWTRERTDEDKEEAAPAPQAAAAS